MQGNQYNVALTTFYVAYILIEVPSNLALKKLGSIWLATLVIFFGVISLGTAFIHTYGQLIATRVLLGIAEGGTLVCFISRNKGSRPTHVNISQVLFISWPG